MHYPMGLFRFQTFFYILFLLGDLIMRRIARTIKGTLRITDKYKMLDISEYVRPEIMKELTRKQKEELTSEETYYTDISDEQFDRCMKICNGSMVD